MELFEFNVDYVEDERLDSYLGKRLKNISRTYIQKLIKEGLVLVNDNISKAKYIVKQGDRIQVKLPVRKEKELVPENIPLDIIYEDKDIVIINKPKGMVVHPGAGHTSGTLVNALLYHIDSLSSINENIRPGIVHRLDKDTSGILIVAKNNEAHNSLVEQLKDRSIKRVYMALVYGILKLDQGIIDIPIGRHPINRKKMSTVNKNGKTAITNFKVLERFQNYTLIEASLLTGRTHQIRVHMGYINHPIVGDTLYSRKKNEFYIDSQLLHAKKIGFIHPRTGNYMEFETELPKEFQKVLKLLRERNS